MATEEKKCSGRCELCNPNQRTYCAAQKMLYMEQDIAEIKAMLRNKDSICTIVAKDDVIIEDE